MPKALVLALLDLFIPFIIEFDASGAGIRAILTQNKQPIAYFSTSLKGQNLALLTYEKELLALVLEMQ